MKRIWVVLGIAIIITTICILEVITTNKFVLSIQNEINKAVEYVEKGDLEKAKECTKNSIDKWNKYKNSTAIFIAHNKIEDIGIVIAVANRNIIEDKKEEFLNEADKLLVQLDYMKSSEIPYIENIL